LTKQRAVLELLFAGALWGFGFVAATWGLKSFTVAEVLGYRYIIAFLMGEIIYLVLNFKNSRWPDKSDAQSATLAGLLLGGMLILQTIGLQYTTATNSGFITTLYVVLVPVISHLVFKHEVTLKLYMYVALALIGTLLLVGFNPEKINTGDLWTLACSFVAAFHIIYIGRVSRKIKDVFRFNNMQSLWSFVIVMPLLIIQPRLNLQTEQWLPWVGILSLAVGSSLIGFYIQVRTQRVLSNTTASMLFLLESPFAFLFGSLFLAESLNPRQLMGAALIMLASYWTIQWERTSQTK
jgi:drug/metabolite transporter (DMT)-like permease